MLHVLGGPAVTAQPRFSHLYTQVVKEMGSTRLSRDMLSHRRTHARTHAPDEPPGSGEKARHVDDVGLVQVLRVVRGPEAEHSREEAQAPDVHL
jgi:hypothetical protein